MNKKTTKELKYKAKQFARSRGLGDWKFGYKELKKLWKQTPEDKKATVFE